MKAEPKYDITDIANWFLCQSDKITHKKLQKLCYYAVAWNWGINKEPLCKRCDFQAWVHGAVNPILYKKYRKYGWKYIPKEVKTLIKDELIIKLLSELWESLHDISEEDLENINHTEDPYIKARGDLKRNEPGTNIIKVQDMICYFGGFFDKGQNL